jgi:hypothetical protein
MGYAGSADIFQAEMMDLMEALEYVRAYIDDPTRDRTRDCVRATRYRGRTIEHAT